MYITVKRLVATRWSLQYEAIPVVKTGFLTCDKSTLGADFSF